MTLAELLITIAIFSIIMIGVSQFFIKSWQNYNFIMRTSEASIFANIGMSKIVNSLRGLKVSDNGSYPILSVSGNDIKFFNNTDDDETDAEKIHYYLNGTDLMVGISKSSGFPLTYPTGDSETEILIKNVVNDETQPMFSYYDGANNLITNPADNKNRIRMVGVSIIIAGKDGNLEINSFASLRNLSDNDIIN